MPIDASIYSNIQTPPPMNPLDSADKAMRLSALSYQMQNQNAVRGAYAQNTDPQSGQLDRAGFLSSLGKTAPTAAMEYQSQFAQQDKQAADAKIAQMQSAHATLGLTVPRLSYLLNLPDDQAEKAYPNILAQWKQEDVDTKNAPPSWDRQWAINGFKSGSQTKDVLANTLTQAQIGKTKSETDQVEKTRLTDYQKILGSDESYKKATGMIADGNTAMNTIDDAVKNPGSAANVAVQLARLATGGARMPEDVLEKNLKAGSYGDQLKDMYNQGSKGTLTQDKAEYSRQFVATQQQSAAQNKRSIENDYASKYAVDARIPRDDAYSRLTGSPSGTVPPAAPKTMNLSDNRNAESGGGIPGVASSNAKSKLPASSVKPGDVRRGYVFNGLDPTNPANWKKVK